MNRKAQQFDNDKTKVHFDMEWDMRDSGGEFGRATRTYSKAFRQTAEQRLATAQTAVVDALVEMLKLEITIVTGNHGLAYDAKRKLAYANGAHKVVNGHKNQFQSAMSNYETALRNIK
jgi:hypothetical protein